jgi:hypothetical protein
MLLVPWVAGCAGRQAAVPGVDPLPVLSLPPAELVERLQREAAAVTRLRCKLEIGMAETPAASFRACRAVLASQSPWGEGGSPGLFLEGYRALLPTLFTLVSDGREFWLHVPYDNVVYTGPVDGPHPVRAGREIRLDVADLFRALFLEPLGGDSLEIESEGIDYVVSSRDAGIVKRRLWVERRQFVVRREVRYGPDGRERLVIERDAPADPAAAAYPSRLLLRDAATGGTLRLAFASVTVNPEKLHDEVFRPRIPPGAKIQRTSARGGET